MRRTNIYLTDDEHRLLTDRARTQGVSMAELVRQILDRALGLAVDNGDLVEVIEASAGAWSDRTDADVEELRRLRSLDRTERLELP